MECGQRTISPSEANFSSGLVLLIWKLENSVKGCNKSGSIFAPNVQNMRTHRNPGDTKGSKQRRAQPVSSESLKIAYFEYKRHIDPRHR